MAIRPIRIIGDPVLRTVCDPITEITPNVKALVEDLLEGVDMEGRAGLAANQIGVSLRAFSWNIDGEIGYVLNPRIVALSEDEYQDGDEGCLSVPDLWYPTERAWYARCEGTDLDGKKVVVEVRNSWLVASSTSAITSTDTSTSIVWIDRRARRRCATFVRLDSDLPEVDQSAKRAGKCPAFPGALLYPVSTSCVLVSAHFVATPR